MSKIWTAFILFYTQALHDITAINSNFVLWFSDRNVIVLQAIYLLRLREHFAASFLVFLFCANFLIQNFRFGLKDVLTQ